MTALASIRDPRLRIVALFGALALGVSVSRWTTAAAFVGLGVVWLAAGGVPARFFWRRFRLVLPLIGFMLIYFPLAEGSGGWGKAALYAGRLTFAAQTLTLAFHGLTPQTFFQTLLRLKVPSIFVEMALFTLRYVDVFREEALAMRRGLHSRGFRVGSGWFSVRTYAALSKLLGSLLLRVLRRSERVYLGMLSRGYRGRGAEAGDLPASAPGDGWKAAWLAGGAIILFVWDFTAGG
ncbi:energy-coupling factor transporter transmembrane component T [Paenibacillus sp.]|uniref:energy-coupling factor transporter transmembrane component T family protein n=1 Tax=Paenibacillus sp. TaxID=58172 RepID=UPI002D26F5DA|nr:energy-coupling factor transporter transmembrane component T [Paenibacillus sp.]HZG88395.1 energy-coupling factor transporter transmembrane component T [Paenibacillus sp.]